MIISRVFKYYGRLFLTMIIPTSIKIDEKTIKLVDNICNLRGENRSNFIRRAVLRELARLSYLDNKSKKALEVEND